MIGIDIEFKNRPNDDGSFETFTVKDCLIAQNGGPAVHRSPQIIVHLPKTAPEVRVDGAFLDYDGFTYHVLPRGTTAPSIEPNTPTRWNRYCIAERIY
jgi:hypothetical protein